MFGIGIILITFMINLVVAEPIKPPKEVPFSLSSWIRNTFFIEEFSVVGQTRLCDETPIKTETIGWGETLNLKASLYCSSGHGLVDVFFR